MKYELFRLKVQRIDEPDEIEDEKFDMTPLTVSEIQHMDGFLEQKDIEVKNISIVPTGMYHYIYIFYE